MSLENSDTKDDDKISSSPDRHTFQKEGAIKRAEEAGEEPNQDYLDMWDQIKIAEANKIHDSAWQRNNMEYDLRSNKELCDKVKASDAYAQNLYAAMCNMRFVRKEMFPYLRQDPDRDLWSVSWRSSGGIVADMREQGDYIDWYCSGMGGLSGSYDPEGSESFNEWQTRTGYVAESVITEEIEQDLFKLGWIPVPWDDDDLV